MKKKNTGFPFVLLQYRNFSITNKRMVVFAIISGIFTFESGSTSSQHPQAAHCVHKTKQKAPYCIPGKVCGLSTRRDYTREAFVFLLPPRTVETKNEAPKKLDKIQQCLIVTVRLMYRRRAIGQSRQMAWTSDVPAIIGGTPGTPTTPTQEKQNLAFLSHGESELLLLHVSVMEYPRILFIYLFLYSKSNSHTQTRIKPTCCASSTRKRPRSMSLFDVSALNMYPQSHYLRSSNRVIYVVKS